MIPAQKLAFMGNGLKVRIFEPKGQIVVIGLEVEVLRTPAVITLCNGFHYKELVGMWGILVQGSPDDLSLRQPTGLAQGGA